MTNWGSAFLVIKSFKPRWKHVLVFALLIVVGITPRLYYEYWRYSVQVQIVGEVNFREQNDICKWLISPTTDPLLERAEFDEGGAVKRVQVGSWPEVLGIASSQVEAKLLQSNKTWHEQPCIINLSLTRTFLVLYANSTLGPSCFITVELVYARYAPY